MRFLLLSVIISFSINALAHEGHQAFYRLYAENGTLMLSANVELPDAKAAVNDANRCMVDQDLNFCIGTWLIDQFSVIIDGRTHSLTLESTAIDSGHLLLSFSLGEAPEKIDEITITNTAFTESFKHYENVVVIEFANQKEAYKLTESRTSITHLSTIQQ